MMGDEGSIVKKTYSNNAPKRIKIKSTVRINRGIY